MNDKKSSELSNKELLIRIDERQKVLRDDVKAIKEVLVSKVDIDDDYIELKHKVNVLWDRMNWMIGYGAAGGAIAYVFAQILQHLTNNTL